MYLLTNLMVLFRFKAEDTAWSETLQALNNQQATVYASVQSRLEKRMALDAEFDAIWDAKRREDKGKRRENDGMDIEEEDSEAKAEAKVLSTMWDAPTDAYHGSEGGGFAESVRLVEEERRIKARGGLDE